MLRFDISVIFIILITNGPPPTLTLFILYVLKIPWPLRDILWYYKLCTVKRNRFGCLIRPSHLWLHLISQTHHSYTVNIKVVNIVYVVTVSTTIAAPHDETTSPFLIYPLETSQEVKTKLGCWRDFFKKNFLVSFFFYSVVVFDISNYQLLYRIFYRVCFVSSISFILSFRCGLLYGLIIRNVFRFGLRLTIFDILLSSFKGF